MNKYGKYMDLQCEYYNPDNFKWDIDNPRDWCVIKDYNEYIICNTCKANLSLFKVIKNLENRISDLEGKLKQPEIDQ